MKEFQITIKAKDEKELEEAIRYAIYEISLGVKDNDIDIVVGGGNLANLKFKVFEDL